MKRILKKTLIILLIILTLNNFMMSSVHAVGPFEVLGTVVSEVLDKGVIGILATIYKIPMLILGELLNKFTALVAWSEGSTDPTRNTGVFSSITVYDILFNKVKLIDINFFDVEDENTSLVNKFRTSVAGWFYIMRTISAGILLVILIYVGIRMATSTIASDRAVYKRMLVDWVTSLALIFVLQYIIIFVLAINNAIVNAIDIDGDAGTSISASILQIHILGYLPWGITSLVAAYVFIMLSWQTIGLFFSYFNRMLKIAFLIIIAPLISLTYSIDKMGDGKAQALDSWLKEFVFTILMQPFHCIIYMSLISASLKILKAKAGLGDNLTEILGAAIIVCICISFTKEAEKIVRKIFAFKDDNKKTSLMGGIAAASLMLNKAKGFGKTSVKTVNGVRNFAKNTAGALTLTNIRAEARAFRQYMKSDNDKSYSDLKSEAKASIYDERANKIAGGEENLKQYYESTVKRQVEAEELADGATRFDADLKKEEERLKQEAERTGKPVNDTEIHNLAKLNLAKKARAEKPGWRRNINGATAKVKNIKNNVTDKASKFVRKIDNKIPFQETRKLMARGALSTSMAMFVGAGSYGLNGKALDALGAAVITKNAYNEFASGTARSVRAKNDDLLSEKVYKYTPEQMKNLDEAKKSILMKVAQNPKDYEDDSLIEGKIRSFLDEMRDILRDGTAGNTQVINNISGAIANTNFDTEDVASKIMDVLGDYIKDGESRESLENSSGFANLSNYGLEFGIAKNIAGMKESGLSLDSIIEGFEDTPGQEILRQEKENASLCEIVGSQGNITQEHIDTVRNMSQVQLAGLNRMLEQQRDTLKEAINKAIEQNGSLNSEFVRELERKATAIETKREQLIGEAIASLQGELTELEKQIARSIIQEKKTGLIPDNLSPQEKSEIEAIIKELEKKV